MSQADPAPDRGDLATDDERAELAAKFANLVTTDGYTMTGIPWLMLHRRTATTAPHNSVYEPSVAVVLQGRKQVLIGKETFIYDESRFLLTGIALPAVSRVLEASAERPYMAMVAKLDLAKVRQMILEYELPAPSVTPVRGMATAPVTSELLCSFSRLLDLLDTPKHLAVKADLILKEVIYDLLISEQGGRLWQLAMTGSQSNRIQKVVMWLRQHFAEPLRAEDLAEMAAMSVSAMQHRFRDMTSMSPLQFQKQLRLQEARRLMLVEDLDAGMAALRVGYESASQFSREYSRMFGQAPARDIKLLRASTATLDGLLEGARTA